MDAFEKSQQEKPPQSNAEKLEADGKVEQIKSADDLQELVNETSEQVVTKTNQALQGGNEQIEKLVSSLTRTAEDVQAGREELAGVQGEIAELGIDTQGKINQEAAAEQKENSREARISAVVQGLMEQLKNPEAEMSPQMPMLGDKDKIKNQQLSFLLREDKLSVNCKLTAEHFKQIQQKFKQLQATPDSITIPSSKPTAKKKEITLCRAKSIEQNGIKTKLYEKNDALMKRLSLLFTTGTWKLSETAKSMVNIEITLGQDDDNIDPTKITQSLQAVFNDLLEIPDALDTPENDAEDDYKLARYCWQHKLDPESLSAADKKRNIEKLQRQEVFPGYFTMVEPGKHKQYEQIAPYAVIHNLWGQNIERDVSRIASILKGPGLLSRAERYQRGLESRPAVDPDMLTGGGDSVFTRLVTKEGTQKGYNKAYKGFTIILSPDILDRTDWYSYRIDQFGSTSESNLKDRKTPKEILESEKKKHSPDNELMFRYGIPIKKFKAIACGTEKGRQKLIAKLRQEGITEVNGTPIEYFVIVAKKRSNWVDAVHNEKE